MKITYDPDVDAAYIYFRKRRGPVTTVRLSEDIAIDFGPREEVRGIEILDASRYLGLTGKSRKPKIELENLEIA